jgi:DNA-binding GntR family transcriptional regulator
VVEALERHDADGAAAAMHAHIDQIAAILEGSGVSPVTGSQSR